MLKDLEKKQDGHRETMTKLQSQFQQQQVKAAAKAWAKRTAVCQSTLRMADLENGWDTVL